MTTKLITITPDAETIMGYCARVSNPANQENPDVAKLLGYCAKNEHWSVFEMANMVVEISTSRAISAQILRHRSFCFQEFSQRYASPQDFETYEARRQDQKNRQNSTDDLPDFVKVWFANAQVQTWESAKLLYDEAVKSGVAKECARFLLPMNTSTRLYMNGTVRSWIHYINLRTKEGTQLEHKILAEGCKQIFCEQLPIVAKGLGWVEAENGDL